MTVKELAAFLHIHPTSLYRFVREGRIPYIRLGGTYRFRPWDVLRTLEQRNRYRGTY